MGILYTLVGVLVGGLVNLLADDLPEKRSPGRPRCSQCEQDHQPAHWLAVVRWPAARGRCPHCGGKERLRPLLVELGLALIFGLLWLRSGDWTAELIILSLFFSIFVLVLVTDMEHRLILHTVTFPSVVLALLVSPITVGLRSAAGGAVVGFVVFLLLYLLGQRLFGPGALGFGDVTLATVIGAMVGFPMVIVALLCGILAGGVISLGLVLTRRRRLTSKVPYGPFLLIGGTIAILWGRQIVLWYLV